MKSKTLTIKLQGKILENLKKTSASNFRSITQQVHKILHDFVEDNPIIEEDNDSNDQEDPDDEDFEKVF